MIRTLAVSYVNVFLEGDEFSEEQPRSRAAAQYWTLPRYRNVNAQLEFCHPGKRDMVRTTLL